MRAKISPSPQKNRHASELENILALPEVESSSNLHQEEYNSCSPEPVHELRGKF